jgi:peptidoglycan-associated lipoprotein
MSNKRVFSFMILAVLVALSFSCSKKQTVKPEPQQEPVTETEMTEEVPAVEEEPASEEPVQEVAMPELSDAFFDFDKYNLKDDAKRALEKNATELKKYPSVNIIIEGHCDERGTEDYNMALGEKRAKSAKDYLVSLGIEASRITTISYGESRPFALGHDERAWAQNRRAHFVVKK